MVTTIKFLATDVAPRPDEVDYWVDITDNPYKGTIKYFNGTDWIRLQDLGGDLDLTKYYSKSEVNNLLNEKASVSSVESKLDDSEAASLIKNVLTDSTVDTLKLISTKYDGSTIVLNIPIADNGHTGVITSDKYKDLVTLSEKQALYVELYTVAENIRLQYQRKLIAGKNIKIEDNVISASGDISIEWDKILNKPLFKNIATSGDYNDLINKLVPGKDVFISEDNVITINLDNDYYNTELNKKADKLTTYTKELVDLKVTSVYKIKGSILFSQLPTINNVVGDTYNITDDFTLGNKEYTAGTNIVYTESGWDALSGAFDTTAIESSITEVTNEITQETNRATAVENTKVDKVEGKLLSTNDYTTTEKTKLAGIADNANNYNLPIASSTTLGGIQLGYTINGKTYPVVLDANSKAYVNIPWTDTVYTHPAHTSYINGLYKVTVDALGHVSMATPVVKEDIVALGISGDDFQISIVNDEPTLEWGTVSTIGNINGVDLTVKMLSKPIYTWGDITSKPTFATVAISGKYSDLIDTPTIPSAITESTVSTWGFTKNTGTYSKPSTGIPKTDLDSSIQLSLGKADSALQNYTEKYTGTVTGVKINGVLNSPSSGVIDLGNIVTDLLDLSSLLSRTDAESTYLTKITSTSKLDYSLINGTPTSLPASDVSAWAKSTTKPSYAFSEITTKPTTLSDYGITDAKINNGIITLGGNTITPIVLSLLDSSIGTVTTQLNTHTNNGDIHIPSGALVGQVLKANSAGKAEWVDDLVEYLKNLIELMSYGVEWDITQTTPDCIRVGNSLLHKNLPILSGLRGCVANGGNVNYYLNANNWAYKEDGVTASVLDGTDGTVRVDTGCTFYGKGFNNGNKRLVRISTIQIDSTWIEIPRMLIDSDRCTIDNTNSATPKAVSVVNMTANFRGGGNRSDRDSLSNIATDLGKPRTNLSRALMRTYSQNAGSEMLCYEWYKWILYWLPVIEYATFNLQQPFNATLTTDGYHQGGLGAGVTTIDSTHWSEFNGYYPLTPCGYANDLGNFTGIKTFNVDATATKPIQTMTIARYRGFSNIFGDIWTNVDGIIILNDITSNDGSGNYTLKNVYATSDASKFSDTITIDYKLIGKEITTEGYTKEFAIGDRAEIIPITIGGDATKNKCDYHYAGSRTDTSLRTLLLGGGADDGAGAGLGCFYSYDGVGIANANVGFRSVNKFIS